MKYSPSSDIILLLCSLLLIGLSFPACREEIVPDEYQATHAHDAYRYSLEQADLDQTALGRDWVSASREALRTAVAIIPPYEEAFYADPATAFAVAYRFEVMRGQRIEVSLAFNGDSPGRLFIDLFRVEDLPPEKWRRVASAPEEEQRLEFEPRRDAEYIVRLQPELLRGGQYKITIQKIASLRFPVYGKDSRAIQSGFGAPRDGGRRRHRGVDIFARRGSLVVAPSKARVTRVAEQPVGGRTVWLYDEKRFLHMYFAHLHEQRVKANTQVWPGQVIGTVGNTGNARTTPPHLHFGIYMRGTGAVDPFHFIKKIDSEPPIISADLAPVGKWMRTGPAAAELRSSVAQNAPKIVSLEEHTPLRVLAAAADLYRVRLPDGLAGFLSEDSLEPLNPTLPSQATANVQEVRETPHSAAAVKALVDPGEEFFILGEYDGYWYVKTQEGERGWVLIPPAAPDGSRTLD